MTRTKKNDLLGGRSAKEFLRDYWQKKPLLIRGAFPHFKPIISREDLYRLVAQDDVESRLIEHSDAQWRMTHGPFKRLPSIRKKGWTVLVQGVNLHDDAADRLMQQFRFLPDARLDDLMISYATDTGGVGPHFDSYDVFLLQAHGKRRWRISAQTDLTLIEGMSLKILKNFQAEEEFVLEPGDMLYLPPHHAHDGIAEGECMTYSVGFRAPSYQELGEGLLQFMTESIDLPGRYADPGLEAGSHPAEISNAMRARISAELRKIHFDDDDITAFLGEYLSEPKVSVFFDPPKRPMSQTRFRQAASKRGIALSRKTRMLFCGKHLFINGESFVMRRQDKHPLTLLADDRMLAGPDVARASNDVMDAFYSWYQDGWLVLE